MDYKLDLHNKALDFRSKHGIGISDPVSCKALLDKLKVLCVFKPLSEELSGMVGQLGNAQFMLINANHSIGRQNFTIAHELYHLYFDKNFTTTIIDYANDNRGEEKKAHTFASFFLLPDGLIDLIPEQERGKNRISVQTLIRIEQYYQVSRSALLVRLKNMGLIDDGYSVKHGTHVISPAKMLGYDTSLYEKGNENVVVGEYASLAKYLYDADIISESNYVDYLLDIGIDPQEIDLNAFDT